MAKLCPDCNIMHNDNEPCPLCTEVNEALNRYTTGLPIALHDMSSTPPENVIKSIMTNVKSAFCSAYRMAAKHPRRGGLTPAPAPERLCKVCKEPLNAFGVCGNYNQPDHHPYWRDAIISSTNLHKPEKGNIIPLNPSYDYLSGYHDAIKDTYNDN